MRWKMTRRDPTVAGRRRALTTVMTVSEQRNTTASSRANQRPIAARQQWSCWQSQGHGLATRKMFIKVTRAAMAREADGAKNGGRDAAGASWVTGRPLTFFGAWNKTKQVKPKVLSATDLLGNKKEITLWPASDGPLWRPLALTWHLWHLKPIREQRFKSNDLDLWF